MSFESPTRIAPPVGLQPSITVKTRREHLSRWGARIALFNAIIDHARIYKRALSYAPGAARTRNLRLRRPSLYPVELRAQRVEKITQFNDLAIEWFQLLNDPMGGCNFTYSAGNCLPSERAGRVNFS